MYLITKCKACDSNELLKLKTYRIQPKDHPDLVHLAEEHETIIIRLQFCKKCGFIYHDHVLSRDELQKMYEREDRLTHKKETLQKKVLLERAVGFVSHAFKFDSISSAIDIGSGDFSLIDELSKHSPCTQFDAVNVSFPSDYHGKTRVFRVMLEEMTGINNTYDLIILSHILEHIADFDLFFKQLEKLVHPKTELYIEIPFQVGPTLFLDRGFHAQHINYFTPWSLECLLEKYGYKLNKLEFDTEGGYFYYGIPGVVRAKFSLVQDKQLERKTMKPYLGLFSCFYLFSPHIFIRGLVKRFFQKHGN